MIAAKVGPGGQVGVMLFVAFCVSWGGLMIEGNRYRVRITRSPKETFRLASLRGQVYQVPQCPALTELRAIST